MKLGPNAPYARKAKTLFILCLRVLLSGPRYRLTETQSGSGEVAEVASNGDVIGRGAF